MKFNVEMGATTHKISLVAWLDEVRVRVEVRESISQKMDQNILRGLRQNMQMNILLKP